MFLYALMMAGALIGSFITLSFTVLFKQDWKDSISMATIIYGLHVGFHDMCQEWGMHADPLMRDFAANWSAFNYLLLGVLVISLFQWSRQPTVSARDYATAVQ